MIPSTSLRSWDMEQLGASQQARSKTHTQTGEISIADKKTRTVRGFEAVWWNCKTRRLQRNSCMAQHKLRIWFGSLHLLNRGSLSSRCFGCAGTHNLSMRICNRAATHHRQHTPPCMRARTHSHTHTHAHNTHTHTHTQLAKHPRPSGPPQLAGAVRATAAAGHASRRRSALGATSNASRTAPVSLSTNSALILSPPATVNRV